MKLPVKVRVSRKKIAFFFFYRLVPPTRNMEGRKRVRSDKTDMPNFLADMSVDPKVGSMIPEDLSTKCSMGFML